MLICFDSDSDLTIHDKEDNEMLICFDSDTELSTPGCTTVSQSANESQTVNGTECKNNTKTTIDTPVNVTVYDAKLPETMGWTMTIPINIKGKGVLKNLLLEYEDVFAKHDMDLGSYTTTTHRIHTGDAAPIRMRMRRTPLGFQKEEETMLQSMLEQGIVQPSESEWAAAPVIVRKRCGGLRYCLDFRKLNSVTRIDAFPIPLIEECLDHLEGNLYFSTLDMASGYWQINIEPEDLIRQLLLPDMAFLNMREWPRDCVMHQPPIREP